jgi:hypothetical protein
MPGSGPRARLGRPAFHIGHHHQTVGEQPAVRRRDRHRHGQTLTIEVLEELGPPREISVAPGTETTDGEVPIDAHASHVIGDSASERFDASDVFTPVPECLPSHRPHLRRVPSMLACEHGHEALDISRQPSRRPAPKRRSQSLQISGSGWAVTQTVPRLARQCCVMEHSSRRQGCSPTSPHACSHLTASKRHYSS